MSVTANNRRREPGKANNDALMLGGALAAIAAIGIVWVSVALGSEMDGVNEDLSKDPFEIISGLARGTVTWSGSATAVALAAVGVIATVALWFLYLKAAGRKKRANVDHAARYMATERDLAPMLAKEAMKKSKRLGVEGSAGVPVGRLVSTGKMVYASFEDMITVVAGPRVGKSTSLVIPAIIAAPGAVVTTSNKRDVLDATRDVRAKAGPVWVFDPQRVAREDATWWWNPLSYVTDDTRAAKLAQYFASGSRATDAKTDAFFDGAGQNLLAGMLLAAAVGGRPIAQVFSWLTDSTDEEPVRLLREGGYPMIGDAVLGIIQSTDKLRGSVYSTGQEMAACLKNTQVADWVNPRGADDPRPQFDAAEFVRGRGTLYSLSKEGAGTAGPLVTALTAATLEAATDLADTSPGAGCAPRWWASWTRPRTCAGGGICPTCTRTSARAASRSCRCSSPGRRAWPCSAAKACSSCGAHRMRSCTSAASKRTTSCRTSPSWSGTTTGRQLRPATTRAFGRRRPRSSVSAS